MQSLYELLKASKGLPVSDSYAALWTKKAESGIKTLTGRLPLFFSTSESKLRDWVIYGNNEPGKNLLDLGEYDNTAFGLRAFAEDGQLRIVGKYNDTSAHTPFRFYTYLEAGSYILSGSPNYSNTGYAIQAGTVINSSGAEFVAIGYDRGDGLSFTLESASWVAIRVYTGVAAYGIDVDFALPIMLRKADTSEAFEPYQKGVGERTKNKANISGTDTTQFGGRWYAENGYLRAVGKYNDNAAHSQPRFYYDLLAGSYTVTGSPDYTTTGIRILVGTYNRQTDTFTLLGDDRGSGFTFTLTESTTISLRFFTASSLYQQDIDLTIPFMLRKADTTPEFIPYGYQVPITVSQTGQTTKNHEIFVGQAPLTEGQSVSDTQPIEVFEGEQTISTALTNKPVMTIKYKE